MGRPNTPLPLIIFFCQLHQSLVVIDGNELEDFGVFHLFVVVGCKICLSIFICIMDPFLDERVW